MSNCVALLPMKGHSARVPNKNIRTFAGEPLFFKVAHCLQACDFIDKILIDTDSPKISEMALKNFSKVQIVERPAQLLGDDVPMNSIIAHDMSQVPHQYFLQTHSTNPLLSPETLTKAWQDFQAGLAQGKQSLFSVTRLQTRLYDHQLKPINHNPNELLKTQDLPPCYEENSNFYFFTRSSFLESGKRIGSSFSIFEMNKLEALDIDYEEDFQLAEFVYKMKKEKK
ncbi:MAG: acylneuraminate cytidylyltransferase family protein [Pseudobdellovibrionaceae bacterium]